MAAFLSNVFNDPSSPWYYVIGVLFLVLIFGALAVYIILSNKLKKSNDGEQPPAPENSDASEKTETEEKTEEVQPVEETSPDEQERSEEKPEVNSEEQENK